METKTELTQGGAGFSPTTTKIIPALIGIQAKLRSIPRSAKNPFFNSSYADLATIMDTIRPLLVEAKIAIVQLPESSRRKQGMETETEKGGKVKTFTVDIAEVALTTYLMHESGEYIYATLTMDARDAGPQSIGSAVTYARRYGLVSLLGVVSEGEDDDGNRGQRKEAGRGTRGIPAEAKRAIAKGVADQWDKHIAAKIAEPERRNKCIADFLAEHYDGVTALAELPDDDLTRLRDYFKNKVEEKLSAITEWTGKWTEAHPPEKKPEATKTAAGTETSTKETAKALTPDERNALYEKIAVGFRDLVLSADPGMDDDRLARAAQAFTKEVYKVDTLAGVPDARLLILATAVTKEGPPSQRAKILSIVKAWSDANPPAPAPDPLDEALGTDLQKEIAEKWSQLRANCTSSILKKFEKQAEKYKEGSEDLSNYLDSAILAEQEQLKRTGGTWKK
jgi:hypothetical protein